jgi:hypothetical protein
VSWLDLLHGDPRPWLLEPDLENPGVRYFALRDLLDLPPQAPEVLSAREAVMATGPVPMILDAQRPDGGWLEPGPGYLPKYTGAIWQVTFLAQLGADGSDPRVHRACEYVLEHSRAPYGGFSIDGRNTGLIHCLQGNLCAALLDMGMAGDPRLTEALDWLARSVMGEGIAPAGEKDAPVHYYLSGNCGPGFRCSANDKQPCAWGAVKAALALTKVPADSATPAIQRARDAAAEFLLSRDPAVADYPMGYSQRPSRSWFQFGYPIAYVTDVLQNLEALALLGYAHDPRLEPALRLVLGKQDALGRWKMEYTYNGKTWADIEEKGKPSKWVTLRALRMLKAASD